jgi:XTP/dITP diphosphohydrolase
VALSVLDGVSFGQPALSLAAQLQRRVARAGIRAPGSPVDSADRTVLTAEHLGEELMALVARAREAGLDPEVELRGAARRFARSVREQERLSNLDRDP